MTGWKKLDAFEGYLIGPGLPVRDVLERFNVAAHQFMIVTDDSRRLLGTVTDGDVRRGILRGVTVDDRIEACMHREPFTIDAQRETSDITPPTGAAFVPRLDREGRVIEVLLPMQTDIGVQEAIVMAGGMGQRLGKLTERTPKPLLQVGGKPIIERILENLEAAGVERIWISVNHMAEQFAEFIAERKSQAEILFLHEEKKLGTAGAIGLLPAPRRQPFLVLNGDVLTNTDFTALDAFHHRHRHDITIAVAHHQVQVPFGVVRHDDHGLFLGIDEKPIFRQFVAAGIYYLNPEIHALVPRNARMDMPELLNEAQKIGMRIGLFPIHEYWTDVGRPEDLKAADAYHKNGK
jgi:dTDP-glucose pyrophosphorylase